MCAWDGQGVQRALMGAGLALLCAASCSQAPRADARLYQPQEDGVQQMLELSSDWAHFASEGGDTARILLEWPLPGSRQGRKQYFVYVRVPADAGSYDVGDSFGDGQSVGGFLIQRAGRLQGITKFVLGRVDLKRQRPPSGRLEMKCEDGTEVRATFTAESDSMSVVFFEHDRANDMQQCLGLGPAQFAGSPRKEVDDEQPAN